MGHLILRPPNEHHQPFLERVFRNQRFMAHFHRFQSGSPEAVRRYIEAAKQTPFLTRRLDWVVQDAGGPCIGLAGLVDIDWPNGRAELLVGFPTVQGAHTALQASVGAISFGFEQFRLQKLVSQVYGDNAEAQANTLHLGFTQEGQLRKHIAAAGERLDVFVNGLLREEFEKSALLQRLRRRWINSTGGNALGGHDTT